MKKTLKKCGIGIVVLVLLSAMYMAFMTLCYMLPVDGKIKDNIGESLGPISGASMSPILENVICYMPDIDSDMLWINMAATKTNNSPFIDAINLTLRIAAEYPEGMKPAYYNIIRALYYPEAEGTYSMNYSRYWMLMVGFMKIMFSFWTLSEIRIFIYLISFTLMGILIYRIGAKLDWRGAVPLIFAMMLRLWLMNTLSFCTSEDIIITMVAMLIVIHGYDKKWFKEYEGIIYLVIGSISFAFGPLVAPMLTIGMPLILQTLLQKREDKKIMNWLSTIKCSFLWVVGYSFSVFSKLFFSKLFVGMDDTTNEVLYWFGPGQGVEARLRKIVYCLKGLMTPFSVKFPLVIILLFVLIVLLIKRGGQKFNSFGQIFFLGLYPFIWVFAVVEHSTHYFVANIFSIFVYAALTLFAFSIKDKKVK